MVTPGFVVRKIIGILGAYFGITKSGNNVSIIPPNGGTISIPGLTVAATAPFQVTDGGSTVYCQIGTAGVEVQSADQFSFSTSSTDASVSPDTGLARSAAGLVNVTNGSTVTYLQLGVNTGVNGLLKCVNPTATTGASVAGRTLTIESGDAVASTDTAGAAAGGDVTITAGSAKRLTSGNANGGNIVLSPGAKIGSGADGYDSLFPNTAPAANEEVRVSVGIGFSTAMLVQCLGGAGSGYIADWRYGTTGGTGELVMRLLLGGLFLPGRAGSANQFICWGGDAFTQDAYLARRAANVLSLSDPNGANQTWLQNTAAESRRAATQTVTDSASLTADNALTATLIAGRKYRFRIRYYMTTVNTSGVQVDLNGGTATMTAINGFTKILSSAGAVLAAGQISALNTAVGVTASGTFALVEIEGSLTCNAGGTFIPRFAQNAETGAAESVVAQIGSFMELGDVP